MAWHTDVNLYGYTGEDCSPEYEPLKQQRTRVGGTRPYCRKPLLVSSNFLAFKQGQAVTLFYPTTEHIIVSAANLRFFL